MEYAASLPGTSAKLFFVGIGGIGMSGLAQELRWQGYDIAGSDRGLEEPGKAELYQGLASQGIRLYPQDGSGVLKEKPDALVISTAVEANNPDLLAAKGIPVIHRARALAQSLSCLKGRMIAVAGSCGKTSVTGWIASALKALGERVLMVNGGYLSQWLTPGFPGNFFADEAPDWLVVEVDESDKSISEFSPEYGLLLNVGNDHYEEAELKRVFSEFLGRCTRGVSVEADLKELAGQRGGVTCFSDHPCEGYYPVHYQATPGGISFEIANVGLVTSSQSGVHSACNACAVFSVLKSLALPYSDAQLLAALGAFEGVRQRFEAMGQNEKGVFFINDYAHNPEKVAAAISTARERFGAPLLMVFQPHGFTPLKFMREELVRKILSLLEPEDAFVMLPVFYAGGTASFSPTSQEVVADFGKNNVISADRSYVEKMDFSRFKAVLVMGARDSSLRGWTARLSYL